MDATFREVLYMTATIYGEARGEYYKGKVAVGWVIRNRAQNPAWWGDDIVTVCTKPYQFSCWNRSDPNARLVKRIATGKMLDDKIVQQCMRAALEVLQNRYDPTFGSDHYHHINIRPAWADNDKSTGTIGHHKFYTLGSR